MNDYFAALQAGVAACVDNFTPAHWFLVGLVVFLVLMLAVCWFEDYWLAVEHAFQAHGVGGDDTPRSSCAHCTMRHPDTGACCGVYRRPS